MKERNQMVRVLLDMVEKSEKTEFKSLEVAKHCWALQEEGNPIINSNADNPYFQHNYIASTLHNYCVRHKKPKIQRRQNEKGIWLYSLKTK